MRNTAASMVRTAVLMITMMAALAACSDESTTPTPNQPKPVATVAIQPATGTWTGTLQVGQTMALAAKPRAADGTELPPQGVAWTTTDAAVLTVTATGMIQARAVGTAEVLATIGGKVGRQMVQVTAAPTTVARVQVSPAAAVLEFGQSRQYTARAYDAQNNEVFDRAVTWRSDAPGVATVTAGGVVKAVAAGYGQITATIDGVQGTVALTVTAEPVRVVVVQPASVGVFAQLLVQLEAKTLAINGRELTGRTVTWTSENPEIAQVGPTGIVLGIKKGQARIRATSEGVSGYALVTVRNLSSDPVQLYSLQGTEQLPVPYIEIGRATWTDPGTGIIHEAFMVVTGGTLRLDLANATYQSTFEVKTFLSSGPVNQPPVQTRTVADAGTLMFDFQTGLPVMHSTTTPGLVLRPSNHGAGEYLIRQSVLGTASVGWLWVID